MCDTNIHGFCTLTSYLVQKLCSSELSDTVLDNWIKFVYENTSTM